MRIAITGGHSRLARALADALGREHAIGLAATNPAIADGGAGIQVVAGDLREPAFAARVVEGADALFHLAPLWPGLLDPGSPDAGGATAGLPGAKTAHVALDHATRGTYVLLTAAAQARVRRVVLASTLDLFAAYPSEWWISEAW